MLHERDDPTGHEPGRAHGFAGPRDLDDLDDPAPGGPLDAAAGARVATISYVREPSSAATTISTRSPLMARAYRGASLRLVQRLAAVLLATGAAAGGAVVVADDGHDSSAPRPPARVRTPATQALP